jgi:hypothetical protein
MRDVEKLLLLLLLLLLCEEEFWGKSRETLFIDKIKPVVYI